MSEVNGSRKSLFPKDFSYKSLKLKDLAGISVVG
jgi:hypothetical protein